MRYVKCKTCGHESIVNEQDEFFRCSSCGSYNELNAIVPKSSIRCIRCNTPLDAKIIKDGVLECNHCHQIMTFPKDNQTDDVKQLIENGKIKLNICHFKEALELFKIAIEKAPNEPEAYFNYALARYQIQYLRDITNKKMQPICHVYRDKPFTEDQSYNKALSLATNRQKEEYQRKAIEIEKIQMEFSKLEKQKINYDCFICTKVSEYDKGNKKDVRQTIDCQKAYDIYHMLINKGFHPFFSEALMSGHTGEAYEAHILYALYKAKCMLIVCSDESYLDTPWVKNEYTRYIGLINSGNKKVKDSLAIVYLNSVIETLPIPGYEDTKLQGLDFKDSLTFADSLTNFLNRCLTGRIETEKITVQTGKKEKIITPKQDIQLKTISDTNVVNINPNLEEVLKKVNLFINSYNDFNKAKEYITIAKHIDINNENSEIDYFTFLIKYKIHGFKELNSDLKFNVKEIDKIIKKSNSDFAIKIFSEIYECLNGLINSRKFNKKFLISLYEVVEEYNDESVNKLSDNLVSYAIKTCDNEIFFAAYKARSKSAEYINQYRENLLTLLKNEIINKKFESAQECIKVLDELYSGNVTVLESKLLIKYHCANFEELFKYETKFNEYNTIKEILEYSTSVDKLILQVTNWIDNIIYKLINDTKDKKKKLFYYKHIENLIKFINDGDDNDNSDDELQRNELKKLGEQAQKDLNFSEAIKYYKLAINIDSKNIELQAEIYFNMALCDLKCATLKDSYNMKSYIFDSVYYTSLINYLVDKNRLDLKEHYNQIEIEQSKKANYIKQSDINKHSVRAQKVRKFNAGIIIVLALLSLVFSFFDFSFISNEFIIATISFNVIMLLALINEKITFRKISTSPYLTNQVLIFTQSYFITNLIYRIILEKSIISTNFYLSLVGVVILIIYLISQIKNSNEINSLKNLLIRFIPALVLGALVALELLTCNIIYLITGAAFLLLATIILRKYKNEILSLNFIYIFTYLVFLTLYYIFDGNYLSGIFNIIQHIAEFDYLKIGLTLFIPLINELIVECKSNWKTRNIYNLYYFIYAMLLVAILTSLIIKVNFTQLTAYIDSNYSQLVSNKAFYQFLFCLVPQVFMSIFLCKEIKYSRRKKIIICFILSILVIVSKLANIFINDLFNSYTFESFIIIGIDFINILIVSIIVLRKIQGGKIITTCLTLFCIGGIAFGYIKELERNYNFNFSLNDNDVALKSISGKEANNGNGDVVIPSYFDGKKVTELSSKLFKGDRRKIKNLYIPNTITTINEFTFYNVDIDYILYNGTLEDWCNIRFVGNPGWNSNLCLVNYEKEELIYNYISDIVIPNRVTSIGMYQFAGIKSLSKVIIPSFVTSIGKGAFNGCNDAIIYCCNVSLAESATEWNESKLSVVYGTDSNSNMILSLNDNDEIEYTYLAQQENIIIPRVIEQDGKQYAINKIGKNTFTFNNSVLKSITIPNNITKVSDDVFKDCTSLENVYYEGTIEDWCNIRFSNEYSNPMSHAKHFYMLNSNNEYEEVTSIEIPNTVTSIGNYQFYGFNNVTSITIPSSVTSIGNYVFEGCTAITIYCEATSAEKGWISNWNNHRPMYYGITQDNKIEKDGIIYVVENNEAIVTRYVGKDTKVSIPFNVKINDKMYNVTKIGDKAFSYSAITSVRLSNIITIGYGAFSDCTSLKYIEIPSNVTKIENHTFSKCVSLTSITIPNSVTEIGNEAFSECKSLTSITIPNSVTTIGRNAFLWCSSLIIYCEATSKSDGWNSNWNPGDRPVYYEITNYNKVEKGGITYVIKNNEAIVTKFAANGTLSIIPSTIEFNEKTYDVKVIGRYAFSYTSLMDIIIPSSVTTIENYAFSNSELLENIIIPNSVVSIGDYAFSYCTSLKNILLPSSVTTIGENAFLWCSSLIIYCESTSKLNGWSSNWNPGDRPVYYEITKDNIIEDSDIIYVIRNNEAIVTKYIGVASNVTIPNIISDSSGKRYNVTAIGDNAFSNCVSLKSIIIPSSVTTIGTYVFERCYSLTIYCEAASEPENWDSNWNPSLCTVVWDYKIQSL